MAWPLDSVSRLSVLPHPSFLSWVTGANSLAFFLFSFPSYLFKVPEEQNHQHGDQEKFPTSVLGSGHFPLNYTPPLSVLQSKDPTFIFSQPHLWDASGGMHPRFIFIPRESDTAFIPFLLAW